MKNNKVEYQVFQIAKRSNKKWHEDSLGKIKIKEEKKGLHLILDKNTLKNIESSNNQNYILCVGVYPKDDYKFINFKKKDIMKFGIKGNSLKIPMNKIMRKNEQNS